MLLKGIKITICVAVVLSIFLISSCTTTKGTKSVNNAEAAAKLLMDHPGLSDFETLGAPSPSRYIVISLKNGNMTGRQKETKMTYNKTLKKWTGSYTSKGMSGKGGDNGSDAKLNNLTPKSGWLPLMKMLTENNIHTIRDAKSIDYKSTVADGNSYTIKIRVGDKQREYAMSNPMIYASDYPDIPDFGDFAKIVEILQAEFMTNE